ncbi:MAG: hypothetical protein DMF80_07320 [Acidobacteria bacterium]|nr:MAG: hypothetical protein DMF80_07320 [Acidobacteriota bacterium]PYQ18113.1 MAG: hypothetical protein DMF81_25925 [Acidobacteriota bacterium]
MKCILRFPLLDELAGNEEVDMRLWTLFFGAFAALGDWMILGQIVTDGPDVDNGGVTIMDDPYPPPKP